MAQRRTGQDRTTSRNTSKWRGQKINACCVSALQENCSHRIRRKTATPEATFVVFLFYFYLFITNVTRALPLEAIKGRQRPHLRQSTRVHRNQAITHPHTTLTRDLGFALSRKLVTPTTSTSIQRQHEQQQNPLDVGSFMPEPVYILMSVLCTIQALTRRYKFTRRSF
jgi:hypothetical protein